MERLLIADVGSTTTKAVLFVKSGDWSYRRFEAPTTVEAPHEDVTVGLRAALEGLSRATGERLLAGDDPALPLLATSSAGGGLAMVVTGLIRRVTSRSAERAALGAGAILLDTIALDDGRVPYKKLGALKSLRPDILLFAGGFDGEAYSGPVFLAEIVRQADLRPKLSPEARLPVVYAGNVNARDLVEETLGDRYVVRPVPNLRPEAERENLEPARSSIHELFMEHVMSHAPGYRGLAARVSAPILPTPSAVARLLETVTAGGDERMLVVDVGGATTDVYTARGGEVFRTVSANLGMSYSLLNVVDTAGISAIHELLNIDLSEIDLLNRLGNKYLDPTRLPPSAEDQVVEWAAATVAVRHAVMEHLAVLGGAPLSRSKEELEIRALTLGRKKRRKPLDETLALAGYDVVVGSGGILSHSPREAAAEILIAALNPVGAVGLAVDSAFLFPQLGILSRSEPELAVELFHALGLTRLGTLLASRGDAVSARGERSDGGEVAGRAPAGRIERLPLEEGASADLKVRGLSVKRATALGGPCGLLLDARGRPPADRRTRFVPGHVEVPPRRDRMEVEPVVVSGALRERRELAVPGTVVVEAGERVEPDTLVARCTRTFPRPFFLRPADALDVAPSEVAAHLVKGVGDTVETDEVLARRSAGILRDKSFRSPVAGTFERLLPDGTVVLREKEEGAGELVAVQVARELDLLPRQCRPYFRVSVGDEVEKGQPVARRLTTGAAEFVKSPVRGKVARIDEKFGIVLVEPILEELAVRAWLPGRVLETTGRGAVIEGSGTRIRGSWGCGGEGVAPLAFDRLDRGHIAAIPRPRAETLDAAIRTGVAGLVVPGLDLAAVRAAEPPFPVVLTESFGAAEMGREVRDALSAHRGRPALIDGTTVLRVGVRRPRVILPDSPGVE